MVMDKLPHNPAARHHAWSDDPARDRAVRLAEDGVERRATLEECIARVFPSKPREIGKELVERLQRFTDKMLSGEIEMPTGMPSTIPKTVSASSPADHENKGESMGGIFHIDTEATMKDEKHPEGMRTERVTLEITSAHDERLADCIVESIGDCLLHGESVRVVPDAEIDASWRAACESARLASSAIDDLTRERDTLAARVAAADKEREEMRESALAHHNIAKAALDEKDKAEARVAELEKARSMFSCECYGEPKSWRRIHERWRDDCDAILDRNSPPEVVLPEIIKTHDAFWTIAQKERDRQWIAALAAAGVKCKE